MWRLWRSFSFLCGGTTPPLVRKPLMVWVRMFWYSIAYEWGGGVVPHFYCDSPGHAQNTKKCLRVDQPFLQLPVKFQLHTSSQKFFRDKCVRSIVIRPDDVLPTRRLWRKHWKYFFRYNFTTVGRIFTKLGRNVLLDDTYAVSKPKFEIRKSSTFYTGVRTPLMNGGGCCTAHSRA